MGGAYTGVAEGVDGVTSNVAAPGVRAPFSSHHVDYDLTASIYLPGVFASTDFENRGSLPPAQQTSSASNFVYGNAGLALQVGPFASALTLDATSYTLVTKDSTLNFRVLRAHAIVAWAFLHHQLVVGVGAVGVTMNLSSSAIPLAPPSGVGPEIGALLKLDDEPWRVGVSARAPVYGGVSGVAAAGTILPSSIVLPGEIEIGFALQLGPRPLNPRWIDPSDELEPLRRRIELERLDRSLHEATELAVIPEGALRERRRRELDGTERAIRRIEDARMDAEEKRLHTEYDARYANWPRPKLLVVADAVITAPVDKAVAVSSFIDQKSESYGRSWTVSPRLGLEGEPFPDRFRLRFGSYLEPSLFDGGSARQHFTFGGDLKLFTWDVFGILSPTTFQVSFATDLAPRYSNWGLSLGVWR